MSVNITKGRDGADVGAEAAAEAPGVDAPGLEPKIEAVEAPACRAGGESHAPEGVWLDMLDGDHPKGAVMKTKVTKVDAAPAADVLQCRVLWGTVTCGTWVLSEYDLTP